MVEDSFEGLIKRVGKSLEGISREDLIGEGFSEKIVNSSIQTEGILTEIPEKTTLKLGVEGTSIYSQIKLNKSLTEFNKNSDKQGNIMIALMVFTLLLSIISFLLSVINMLLVGEVDSILLISVVIICGLGGFLLIIYWWGLIKKVISPQKI